MERYDIGEYTVMKMFLYIVCLLLVARPAYAYIDAGLGSMVVQSLVALLMIVPFYFRKIVDTIKKIFKSNADEKRK